MLEQEIATLKTEIIDYRARIDELMDNISDLEERVNVLKSDGDHAEDELHETKCELERLTRELAELDEQLYEKDSRICSLQCDLEKKECELKQLQISLKETQFDCDRWRTENAKGLKIINKIYNENKRLKRENSEPFERRIKELEKDLEERKATVGVLSESNARLKVRQEELEKLYEEARKKAEEWEAKFDKKEKMFADLLQLRRSTPVPTSVIPSPYTISPTSQYIPVLGRSLMPRGLTTPQRTLASTNSSLTPTVPRPLMIPPRTVNSTTPPVQTNNV
ncbi:hypothetical protein AB6A40_010846 [Gnathostoma spinigerum]|uniref:Uncharacterized protein n=1 Tax=Gnathostoma spinigerum TaxID=75299 RepID=A0ABD6F360_9BILA